MLVHGGKAVFPVFLDRFIQSDIFTLSPVFAELPGLTVHLKYMEPASETISGQWLRFLDKAEQLANVRTWPFVLLYFHIACLFFVLQE